MKKNYLLLANITHSYVMHLLNHNSSETAALCNLNTLYTYETNL